MWIATEIICTIVRQGTVTIHSDGQTIFSFTHMKNITLGAGEVAGGASGMDVVWYLHFPYGFCRII